MTMIDPRGSQRIPSTGLDYQLGSPRLQNFWSFLRTDNPAHWGAGVSWSPSLIHRWHVRRAQGRRDRDPDNAPVGVAIWTVLRGSACPELGVSSASLAWLAATPEQSF